MEFLYINFGEQFKEGKIMKRKVLFLVLVIICKCFCFAVTPKDMEPMTRVHYKNEDISGYVYFEGFNFEGYEAESKGIEPMLEKTLELLRFYYGKNGSIGKNQPFVFVGHSQGGLRALAMSTYLKQKDPQFYKQLKGVITLSGIDKGLKLLEGQGSVARSTLHSDVVTLTNGVRGTLKVLNFKGGEIFTDILLYELINVGVGEGANALANYLLGENFDFIYPVLNNANINNYAQIRDMTPQSNFIKKYVIEESTVYKQHKTQKNSHLAVEWRRGWLGIPYPVLVTKYTPKVVKTVQVNMKVDKNLPLVFITGTNSNTLSLANPHEKSIRNGVTAAGNIFRSAEIAHYAKCALGIGLLTGSIPAAIDCNKAANWCGNVDYELGEIVGEQKHDGLVAYSSQYLPSKSLVSTGYDTSVLTNVKQKDYSQYNHITISRNSEAKKLAEQYVKSFLGK